MSYILYMELLVKQKSLTSYIYIYIYIYIYGPTFGNAESRLFLFSGQSFNIEINGESLPVSQLCVNTFPATKIALITVGI
jgi:hypothetical protein